MELDINSDWVNFAAYAPPSGPSAAGGSPASALPAAPANGATLLFGMSGGTGRYFAPWWNRDFVAVFAAATRPATAR